MSNGIYSKDHDQLQQQSRKIEQLETRADYKDDDIKELKIDLKDLKISVNALEQTIHDFIISNMRGETTIREYINSLENRVTTLEAQQGTLYKLFMATPAVVAVIGVIAALAKII